MIEVRNCIQHAKQSDEEVEAGKEIRIPII
jgi:hypothetical protein